MKSKRVVFEGEVIGHAATITHAKDLLNKDLQKYAAPGEDKLLSHKVFKVVRVYPYFELAV